MLVFTRKPARNSTAGLLRADNRPVLVTGGAGFIGTNIASRILDSGRPVVVLDNMSRSGVDQNALWLKQRYGANVRIILGDVRNRTDIKRATEGVGHVFHLAAQTAVTESLADPLSDFETNTVGTINLLEELRTMPQPPSIIYTSTNKVYGPLTDLSLRDAGKRCEPTEPDLMENGICEEKRIDLRTPYGCSKGAAEQYVLEYGRSFGVPAIVFRMSCIYGPHQFGTEDQGWVAHFLAQALEGRPLTIFGDGRQVRDILHVHDLVNAFLLAWKDIGALAGSAFNIGGGPANSISLLELVDVITSLTGQRPAVSFDSQRPADQRYYVSNSTRFQDATGWVPRVGVRSGITNLLDWLSETRELAPQEIRAS